MAMVAAMPKRLWLCLLPLLTITLLSSCASGKKRWDYAYHNGKTAVIVNGYAVPPGGLPAPVMRAISAGNQIVGKPYKYGGGHHSFNDSGYDCSGTVSYALHSAGCLKTPTTSTALRKFGKKGEGKFITIYSRKGHTFAVIAGLRLDTGYNGEGDGPRWSTRSRTIKGYEARHPKGL